MTPEDFRSIALSLPEAAEHAHMNHPDFRVRGRVFATLGHPDMSWGMLKLTPAQQGVMVAAEPSVFVPVPGGWGRRGATRVILEAADEPTLRGALATAWRNTAPKTLLAKSLT